MVVLYSYQKLLVIFLTQRLLYLKQHGQIVTSTTSGGVLSQADLNAANTAVGLSISDVAFNVDNIDGGSFNQLNSKRNYKQKFFEIRYKMANTVIQLKRSTSTATPTSLNIAEPAYSYSSNTFFIGSPDGTGVLQIGGYTRDQLLIYGGKHSVYLLMQK